MKIEITVEKMAAGRWVRFAKGKFDAKDSAAMSAWSTKKGIPSGYTPGWAIRVACLP